MTDDREDEILDDDCNEPNVTVLAIRHGDEKELGRYLLWLGRRFVRGAGLPMKKPTWLRTVYANHGGGPCAANQVSVDVDIAPPRCNPPAQPKSE